MTEVLHDLHWLPVASRIKYKLLIVTFKALRTGTSGYLSDLLEKQTTTRRTRSQSSDAPDRLVVPLYSCCIVDRDNKKSMQLDSIMFNSISNPIQKSNKNNLDVVQLAAMVRVILQFYDILLIYY